MFLLTINRQQITSSQIQVPGYYFIYRCRFHYVPSLLVPECSCMYPTTTLLHFTRFWLVMVLYQISEASKDIWCKMYAYSFEIECICRKRVCKINQSKTIAAVQHKFYTLKTKRNFSPKPAASSTLYNNYFCINELTLWQQLDLESFFIHLPKPFCKRPLVDQINVQHPV